MSKLAYVFRDDAEPELSELGRFVDRDATVIDVGAHYGDYALALAKVVGPNGRVIAIEPMAHAIGILERNIALNKAPWVEPVAVALGSTAGQLSLHHHPDPSRASLGAFGEDGSFESVPVVTLDALVAELGLDRVDFIKLDIEGSEVDALVGAILTIDEHQPLILFEYQATAAVRLGHDPRAAWDFLSERGYKFASLDKDRVLRRAIDPGQFGPNYIAIPEHERFRRIRESLGLRTTPFLESSQEERPDRSTGSNN